MVSMKGSIVYFYNKNCIDDNNESIVVVTENNSVFLRCFDKLNNNYVSVKVSDYKNILRILSILGYDIVE